jgi:hypothetical protein
MDESAKMSELLDQLHAESVARRAELKSIAEQLPATLSRRALIRSALADLRHAPNKAAIASRGLRKLARAPRSIVRRLMLRGR